FAAKARFADSDKISPAAINFPALAAELVCLQVAVIVATGCSLPAVAAKAARRSLSFSPSPKTPVRWSRRQPCPIRDHAVNPRIRSDVFAAKAHRSNSRISPPTRRRPSAAGTLDDVRPTSHWFRAEYLLRGPLHREGVALAWTSIPFHSGECGRSASHNATRK